MKQIKELVKHMKCQLEDAQEYIELALLYKDTDRKLADVYWTISKEELHHREIEHEQAIRLVREYEASGKTVPEAMNAVWQWEHEQMIERESAVRVLLSMYK